MKLLLVGGAGFIGLNYLNALVSNELSGISSIKVLDSFTYASNRHELGKIAGDFELEILEFDIRNRNQIMSISGNFDYVLNFAAESHVDRSIQDSTSFVSSNIVGVQNLLDFCLLKSAKFLQVSTDEVYGSIESGSWNEDCALQPNSPYAATKASADLLVRSYVKTFNLNAVVTRSCNNFGPFQHVEKFMPTMITHLINGDLVPIYGNGMNTREWVFVGDNIQGIHKALVYGNEGSVYNLGSGHEYTNIDLFKEVCRVGGFDESLFKFVQDRKGHDYRYSVDFEKASQELNYSPSSEMASQLKATIEWYYERKL